MNIIFKTTLWFIKKFPKFGLILSILSIVVPLVMTLFYGFPETVLLWAVYVEAVIIILSIISTTLNFIIGSLFFNTEKRNRRNRRNRRSRKNQNKSSGDKSYDILRFTLF